MEKFDVKKDGARWKSREEKQNYSSIFSDFKCNWNRAKTNCVKSLIEVNKSVWEYHVINLDINRFKQCFNPNDRVLWGDKLQSIVYLTSHLSSVERAVILQLWLFAASTHLAHKTESIPLNLSRESVEVNNSSRMNSYFT